MTGCADGFCSAAADCVGRFDLHQFLLPGWLYLGGTSVVGAVSDAWRPDGGRLRWRGGVWRH